LKGKKGNSLDITKKLIDYTENEIKKHLHKEGILWIFFDPLSYSDLGSGKAYINNTYRKEILPDYKANRKYSDLYLDTIELYRKYYFNRGDQVKLVYSDEYEADDYLYPILQQLKEINNDFKIALLSNDHDWSWAVSDKIHLINKDWDHPFTQKEFMDMYKFKPTYTSIILYKALFGDSSDNIDGTIFFKKAKFLCPEGIKMLCLNFLNHINDNSIFIDDFIKDFKSAVYHRIQDKKDKNPFDELYLQLKINDLKLEIIRLFFNNISIIRSQLEGKNIDDLIHSNPINETTNSVIHQSIYGISFMNIFGKI
jgi:hypothetical protein